MLDEHVDGAVGQVVQVERLLVGVQAPGAALVEHLLQPDVRDRRDQLEQRRQRLPDRRDDRGVLLGRAEADDEQRVAGREVVLLGHEGGRRRAQAGDQEPSVGRQRLDEVARLKRSASRPRSSAPEEEAEVDHRARPRAARYSKEVTTPKLPPPPRSAQKRSGFSSAEARRTRPSAVTTSAATQVVDVRPALRLSQPMPPPSVRPPMPVWLTKPPAVGQPVAWVAASTSAQVAPPPHDRPPRRRVDRRRVHRG